MSSSSSSFYSFEGGNFRGIRGARSREGYWRGGRGNWRGRRGNYRVQRGAFRGQRVAYRGQRGRMKNYKKTKKMNKMI